MGFIIFEENGLIRISKKVEDLISSGLIPGLQVRLRLPIRATWNITDCTITHWKPNCYSKAAIACKPKVLVTCNSMLYKRVPLFFLAIYLVASLSCFSSGNSFKSHWGTTIERPWLGPEYWSNPLQDWRIKEGRIENIGAGGDRNVFLLTREVGEHSGTLSMSVRLGRMDNSNPLEKGWVGFRIGIRGAFNDYRDSAVRGIGLNCGITADGKVFIGSVPESASVIEGAFDEDASLTISAEPTGSTYRLTVRFENGEKSRQAVRDAVAPEWLTGGLALVSSSGPVPDTPLSKQEIEDRGWNLKSGTQSGGTMQFWFRDWQVSGSKITVHEDRSFGPILFAMHTVSKGVLKLNAIIAPAGNGLQEASLEINRSDWQSIATQSLDPLASTATFRIPDWDDTVDTPYRVVYGDHVWEGIVRKDPVEKDEIVVAAFTGNNDLGFPHADIVRNIRFHNPDLMAFTGDSIYERVGEYGIVRDPTDIAILDYLRKWYIFGWEYSELLKEIPAIAMPDDHDVYQGNIWGAGGRKAIGYGKPGQDQGGYVMDPKFVHVVQTTQTANMPDPYDPTPVEQGIEVYYTDLRYGGIGFAIVEDRKWKDSPTVVLPKADIINGWSQNPDYDAIRSSDNPDFSLLGSRQEKFLEEWGKDWQQTSMKAVISQTIFADICTLPDGATTDAGAGSLRVNAEGEYPAGEVPVQDHDSNGWPQSGRNRALRLLRKAVAIHIAGDQHLGSTIQYGLEDWNDSSWAICVPSVANIFPRRWFPTQEGLNRKPDAPRNTGEFLDGFGNKVTIHAVSNPQANGIEPIALHERAPGYGIIKFNKADRKIKFANWPRWVDATQPDAKPYPGWPIVINQTDSGLPNENYKLPAIESNGIEHPVVQVIDEGNQEIVYTLRVKGTDFTPTVPGAGTYTVRVFDPDTGQEHSSSGHQALSVN